MSGLFYNRRGEKYLSIWMFAVWMVVGVAVVAGFTMFFSDAFDVREIDSKIMLDKVEDCVQNSGILNDELLKGDYDLIKCG
ncbi:MAG: hypothetical protein U9Q06_00280, partial [Nanoarchaeota archaeon]|nr:hypothetical protein [Nanoarchaeota archaeon]